MSSAFSHSARVGAGAFFLALFGLSLFGEALAQDFTFRRVKPPEAGTRQRINIQIEKTWPYETDPPAEEKPVEAAAPAPEDKTASWFWSEVSADLDAADAARLGEALRVLNSNPSEKAAFDVDARVLDDIMQNYGAEVLLATAGRKVSPALVVSVIAVESAGRPAALSQKGAQGLMQLIPATAERFGVSDANDPAQNIRGGTAYLEWLLATFKGDPILSLAGYNAGENAVRSNGGVPNFAETRAYVPKVLAAWDKARMYCQTLPRHVDDGCVFALDRSLSQ